jgi:hypothetical protein
MQSALMGGTANTINILIINSIDSQCANLNFLHPLSKSVQAMGEKLHK